MIIQVLVHVHENVIRTNRSLPNLKINTEDVLNTINDMETNKSSGLDDIYPDFLKEKKTK